MDRVLVEGKRLDLQALQQEFLKAHRDKTNYGAFLSFSGLVRLDGSVNGAAAGEAIAAIEYEMYHALFIESALSFVKETRVCLRCNLGPVTIIHRENVVPLGEPTIAIFLLAAHHEDALEAMRMLLVGIRGRIPLWKKIVRKNGTHSFQTVSTSGAASNSDPVPQRTHR